MIKTDLLWFKRNRQIRFFTVDSYLCLEKKEYLSLGCKTGRGMQLVIVRDEDCLDIGQRFNERHTIC